MIPLDAYMSPAHRRFALRRNGAALTPDAERFPVVALFADISGFSALTTRLSLRGSAGAESLGQILNDRFGRLADLVDAHGGHVQAFAGDAAVAFWTIRRDDPGATAQHAIRCAAAIRDAFEGQTEAADISIRVRIGIGTGRVLSTLVGGVDSRWHTLMGGEAWADMLAAAAEATPGAAVLSRNAQRLAAAPTNVRSPGRERADALSGTIHADAIRACVPRAVSTRVTAGQSEWLAEFLTVTTAFVQVPGLHYDNLSGVADLQRAVSTLQAIVHGFGGSINDLLVDDKGTVLIAAWGVPLHSYEDNAMRATRAALAMKQALHVLALEPAIGITTGRIFAGPVGNARRTRYALIGEPVVLAARLMEAATDQVLCDGPTRAAASGHVQFGPPLSVNVKGRGHMIASEALTSIDGPRSHADDLIGRQDEERTLLDAFAGVEAGGTSLVVLRGQPGIGKSALVGAFLRRFRESTVRTLVGSGEALQQSSPYHAWRPIFEALGIPSAEMSAIIGRAVSAEATRDALAARFQQARQDQSPLIVALEDANWIDSASWALAAEILRIEPALLLVVVTRPLAAGDLNDDSRRLLEHPHAIVVDLAVLSDDAALELARRRLEVDALPPTVADLIRRRAEGHPLFTEQLVRSLIDRGLIRVENHECHADPAVGMPEVPDTLHGLIRSRVDLLSPEEQLTVKIASVLGRTVDLNGLREIHPLRNGDSLEAQLANMVRLELLIAPSENASGHWAFKHAIVHEVAYGALPFEQRRRLHHAAAEWCEHAGQVSVSSSTLAHHWSEAHVWSKALWYLERAGAEALRAGNYRETVSVLGRALTTAEAAPSDLASPYRRGVWLRQLGQANYSLGRLDEAREQLERATALLGSPIPSSPVRLGAAIIRGAASPWVSRLRHSPQLDPQVTEAGAARYEAAWALEIVSAIYYLNHDAIKTAYCLARRFELLGRLVPTDLFAQSSAEMAFLWTYAGRGKQADRLFDRGFQTAQALGDPLTEARVLFSWSVLELGRGHSSQGRARALRSAAIYTAHGEHKLARDSSVVAAYADSFSGEWERGRALYEQMLAEALTHDALLQVAWSCIGLGKICTRQHRLDDALGYLDRGVATVRASGDTVSKLMALGTRAATRAALGDAEGAAADIREALPCISTGMPSTFMVSEGYAGLAEAAITLLRKGDVAERAMLEDAAATACAALRRAAKIFDVAHPSAMLWTGMLDQMRGHSAKATRSWKKGLNTAEQLGLPFEASALRAALGSESAVR